MTIAGATSPVTLAGTVAQGVAEFLGIATALQVAAPGARLVFCFGSGVLDMLRTTFALGSLESGLMGAMATEVGHYLGVPTLNPGLSTDAKHAGIQAGYEKAMKARHRLRRRPRHRLRLGPHRLAQHHVPAAVGHRQRDGGDAAPAARAGRGLGGDAAPARPSRRWARAAASWREGHREAHPRRRALHADACRTGSPTRSGWRTGGPSTTRRARRWSGCWPSTPARHRTSTASSWTRSRRSAASTTKRCAAPAAS